MREQDQRKHSPWGLQLPGSFGARFERCTLISPLPRSPLPCCRNQGRHGCIGPGGDARCGRLQASSVAEPAEAAQLPAAVTAIPGPEPHCQAAERPASLANNLGNRHPSRVAGSAAGYIPLPSSRKLTRGCAALQSAVQVLCRLRASGSKDTGELFPVRYA